jgi:hypothetical protein
MKTNTKRTVEFNTCLELEAPTDDPVYECLIRLAVEQGMTKERAENWALKAMIEIKLNAGQPTWCLVVKEEEGEE